MKRTPHQKLLALIVHPQDLTLEKTCQAIACVVTLNPALDFLQLRLPTTPSSTTSESFSSLSEGIHHLRKLFPLGENNNNTKLIVNAGGNTFTAWNTLAKSNHLHADGWHFKEHELLYGNGAILHKTQKVKEAVQQMKQQNPTVIIGCSVHSVDGAMAAVDAGVDYMHVGTMFPTASHPEKQTAEQLEGPELLRVIRREMEKHRNCPSLIAIGGINTSQHIQQVLHAGADGVAVIRAILHAKDPIQTTIDFRQQLDCYEK